MTAVPRPDEPRPAEDEWKLTLEKAGSLHIGPSVVMVDGERYYSECQVVAALASIYRESTQAAVLVAHACDGILDPRGRLLGIVRYRKAAA